MLSPPGTERQNFARFYVRIGGWILREIPLLVLAGGLARHPTTASRASRGAPTIAVISPPMPDGDRGVSAGEDPVRSSENASTS